MKILKYFKNLALASILTLSPTTAKEERGWNFGVDIPLGVETLIVDSPNSGNPVTVSGYTGTGSGSWPGQPKTTYTLNPPKNKLFSELMIGIRPFIGYTSPKKDDFSKDFKIGIEFTGRVNANPDTREREDIYYFESISDNGWGEWPNAALITKIKQQNIFFLEKPVIGFKDDRENGNIALTARLDHFQLEDRATTASVPYGGGWYGSYESTITSSKDLGTRNAVALSLGLKASIEGKFGDFFGFGGFAELSMGVPIGEIWPGPSFRIGATYKF
jgi:hypothetical protein